LQLYPVHPHACGELFQLILREFGGGWFIPTHVGNSCRAVNEAHLVPVHPHACGELVFKNFFCFRCIGSSPRMWGTHEHDGMKHRDIWFIPTHVGNSPGSNSRLTKITVHPHACGELGIVIWILLPSAGSSPRMWGTRLNGDSVLQGYRFIPTHVGNSAS